MTVRQYLKQKQRNSLETQPVTVGDAQARTGTSQMTTDKERALVTTGQTEAVLPGITPMQPMENPDPLKQRIHRAGSRKWWVRLARRIFEKRELSEEERQVQDERQRRKAMITVLREEARIYQHRIINALNRRELCYRYPKSDRDFLTSGIKSVSFDRVIMQPDAIYLRVNTQNLPRGVGILQLVQEDIMTDLSLAVGRRVSSKYAENIGCFYIIERASGVLGIPNHVKFTDMMIGFPASADGLSIPLGMGANNRPVYRSLGQMYSMLVGGTIGSGKSNVLNVILCSLIARNSPDRLKLILIDLKGGLEFSFYEGIPHLLTIPDVAPQGIAYHRWQVRNLLGYILEEGERRITIMKREGYKDIGRYNQYHRKNHIPHLVLVIDEWADIKLDRESGKASEEILVNIAQRFRAVGIHVIICTQIPKSEIVSTRIKGVLPAKIAFSCPTNQASMAILDHGGAKSLTPAGRCILQWTDEFQIQTPYINDQQIHEIVEQAKAGKVKLSSQAHDVTELEIMQHALNQDNGYLSRDRLYEAFKSRGITKVELSNLLDGWEGKEFIVGSSLYRVAPAAGNRPRRLVALDNQGDDDEQNKP